ncbi:MAG: 50S ribosomal protein L13 [Candidatus Sungbacteria bacterium]|nr:50S ribosomal protein L13 [Candidatus Sungbacteria bacterium]
MEYTIDATNQILGRVATKAAVFLRGKTDPGYDPAKLAETKVVVYHTDRVRTTGKKKDQKRYLHHSGYHGGLKEERLGHVLQRDSRIAIRHAVMGMLPKNRLRARMIKHLELFRGAYQQDL